MWLAPVIRPERPAPQGQESLAQGLYVLSAGYPYGPKGQGNLAQGLPWVSQKNVFSPEGAPGRECYNSGRKTVLAVPSGPFRAHSAGKVTQGKPWAKLSWPFGPQRSTLNTDKPWAMIGGGIPDFRGGCRQTFSAYPRPHQHVGPLFIRDARNRRAGRTAAIAQSGC
jgi:hypothetical protein